MRTPPRRAPFRPAPFFSARFFGIFGSACSGDLAAAVASVVVPLLIVGPLGADAGMVGIAVAADDIGWLLAGPVAGVLIDRCGFRKLLLGSEFLRFTAFAAITGLALLGLLHPATLIALLVVKSVAGVFFLIGSPTLLARGIDPDDLVKANSALTWSQSVSFILGPSLAGIITAAFSPHSALLITTAAYLISFLLLAIVLRGRNSDTADPSDTAESAGRTSASAVVRGLAADFVSGWRYLGSRSDVIRMVASGAQFNFALSMQQAVLIVHLLSLPGFTPRTVGLALGAAGLGGVCAAMSAGFVVGKFGEGKVVFFSVLGGTVVGLLIPLTNSLASIGFLVAGYIGLSVATVVFSAVTGAYRQRTIPVDLLGRVTASGRVISWGIAPVGALAGGAIAALTSPWWGLLTSALLFTGCAFWLVGLKWQGRQEWNRVNSNAYP